MCELPLIGCYGQDDMMTDRQRGTTHLCVPYVMLFKDKLRLRRVLFLLDSRGIMTHPLILLVTCPTSSNISRFHFYVSDLQW